MLLLFARTRIKPLVERLRVEVSTLALAEWGPDVDGPVMHVVDRLDAKDREVLLLAGWEGLNPTQIARVLGISAVAARSRLHRARRRVLKELAAAEQPTVHCRADLEFEEAR